MNITDEQIKRALRPFPHCDNPSPGNGYGWVGHGFGWQLESLTEPGSNNKIPAAEVIASNKSMNSADITVRMDESSTPLLTNLEPQNFHELRDENLRRGSLFEDPNFPAQISSLTYKSSVDRFTPYVWLRPKEISKNAKLFVDGHSKFDVMQGLLGNCWFVASVTTLAMHRSLLMQVIPEDQSFDEKYAGIFHFRIWQYGKWVDVVIDDRLPTAEKKLVFVHSGVENEFWSALLEKAYAKLHGSYKALESGSPTDAMQDFTGGMVELFPLSKPGPNLFKIFMKAFERSSLMFGISPKDPNNMDIISSHVYCIINVKLIQTLDNNKISLLRLRNPWGNGREWNGPWSDTSDTWNDISQDVKKEIGFTEDTNDGEFWMTCEDFQNYFELAEICHLTPDSLSEQEAAQVNNKKWEVSMFEGSWVCRLTAGGNSSVIEQYVRNPQYRIMLTEPDEGDEDTRCTIIIELMQKHRRAMTNKGLKDMSIGFHVYPLPASENLQRPLNQEYFRKHTFVARSPMYTYSRDVTCRFKLSRGIYCIIPSTFTPGEEGSFMLRVFTEKKSNMESYDDTIEFGEVDDMISSRMFTPEEQEMDDRIQQMFLRLASENLDISWIQLKDILDCVIKEEINTEGFPEEVCRSLVALSDSDHSGKLDYEEFKKLWFNINNWKAAFKSHDTINVGTLSGYELRETLNTAGYKINNNILILLVHRYSNKECRLNFPDYILCTLKVKTMIELFNSKKGLGEEYEVDFSIEEWLQATLYC